MKTHFRLAWDVRMQMLVLEERCDGARGESPTTDGRVDSMIMETMHSYGMRWFWKDEVDEVIDNLTYASPFQKYALKRHAKRILKALRPISNYKPRPEPIPDPESSARVQAALMAAAANLRIGQPIPAYDNNDDGSVILDAIDEVAGKARCPS